jgi:hypothetical protein
MMMRRAGLVLLAALALGGCAGQAGPQGPGGVGMPAPDREEAQAREALARWEAAAEPGAAVTVSPPPWDSMKPPAGMSIEQAEVSADGRRLTVSFTGSPGTRDKPCGADYTARVVESAQAVVVLVTGIRHAANETCTAIGALRTAEVALDTPLGERAVLEVRQGMPVPVTRNG